MERSMHTEPPDIMNRFAITQVCKTSGAYGLCIGYFFVDFFVLALSLSILILARITSQYSLL